MRVPAVASVACTHRHAHRQSATTRKKKEQRTCDLHSTRLVQLECTPQKLFLQRQSSRRGLEVEGNSGAPGQTKVFGKLEKVVQKAILAHTGTSLMLPTNTVFTQIRVVWDVRLVCRNTEKKSTTAGPVLLLCSPHPLKYAEEVLNHVGRVLTEKVLKHAMNAQGTALREPSTPPSAQSVEREENRADSCVSLWYRVCLAASAHVNTGGDEERKTRQKRSTVDTTNIYHIYAPLLEICLLLPHRCSQ